jgi:arylsulfatase A-like enzyme
MGWKDIGCAGSTYYETPHIDQLASEGMRLLNAYIEPRKLPAEATG